MKDVMLLDRVNYEYFAEIHKPIDPIQQIHLDSKSILELTTKLVEFFEILKRRYPNHIDFYYKFNYTNPVSGCYSAWFQLYGRKE